MDNALLAILFFGLLAGNILLMAFVKWHEGEYSKLDALFVETMKDALRAIEIASSVNDELLNTDKRVNATLEIAFRYGQSDGAHHKAWVIDQMVRALTGCTKDKESDAYKDFVITYCNEEGSEGAYTWYFGIAP